MTLSDLPWDDRWSATAAHFALMSKDPSTQVGAVIVRDNLLLVQGWNGLPRRVRDLTERLTDRPTKLAMTIHAEMNCALTAARNGVPLAGGTCYVTAPPCSQCAAALIQAGVVRVVHPAPSPEFAARWADSLALASKMFAEAGVAVCVT